MHKQSLTRLLPDGFSLAGVATSHGWYVLAPYRWDRETDTLHRTEELTRDKVVHARITQDAGELVIQTDTAVSSDDRDELVRRLRWCLRLDEDLSEFGRLCEADEALCEAVRPSGGRLLRCPTLWEDVVKTILTTNTTWTQTKAMCGRLVATLGAPHPTDPTLRAFPSPESVAVAGEAIIGAEVRLGYRNGPVLKIAREIAEGRLDLEDFKDPGLRTPELRQRLLALPGVGPYSAATLLMLLGRYDELAIDTELRSHVSRKYFCGEPVTEKQMRGVYERWGRWRYLAYWFDPQ